MRATFISSCSRGTIVTSNQPLGQQLRIRRLWNKAPAYIGLNQLHYGKWILFIGYFAPGVRHFTGVSAGISALDYRDFARFAYSGAFLWVTTFMSIGYFFGPYWLAFIQKNNFNIDNIIIFVIIGFILFALLFKQKI